MENNCERTASGSLVLTQDVVRFGGMQLLYSLSVREAVPSNCFEITVEKDDETAVADAGDALEFAYESYRQIVGNLVTPCTLEDVMRDFEYYRINLQKTLYKRAFL